MSSRLTISLFSYTLGGITVNEFIQKEGHHV